MGRELKFILFILLASFVFADSSMHLDIYLYINTNDSAKILNISILPGPETPVFYSKGNYTFQALSKSGRVVYEKNLSIDFIIFSDPPKFTNETIVFFSIPLSSDLQTIKLFKNKRLIFEENIQKFLCNNDGKCDNFENFYSCPSDCPSGSKDNVCDALIDGRCDPDCNVDVDLDCNPILKQKLISSQFPWVLIIVGGIIIFLIVLFIIKIKSKKKKAGI
jgi:hypothetical protein